MDALYTCYWSLRDPLCQSQSLPILKGLSKDGLTFGLLTYEQPPWMATSEDDRAMQRELEALGISWWGLRYHRKPAGLSTLLDILNGARLAASVGIRRGTRVFHGRGTVGAAVAYLASRLTGRAFFNDADGPLSQEYVDAGIWRAEGPLHRLTARAEARFLAAADTVAVLSEPRRREVAAACRRPPLILPCAVDTKLFRREPGPRQELRASLGLTGIVFVYAGKAGGWYLTAEMLAFVESARRVLGPVSLLVLSPDPASRFPPPLGVPVVHRRARREEMPALLPAADAGLSFISSAPSKRACSPVKNGEYLACGLPIVSTAGIGDYSDLLDSTRTGVIVRELSTSGYLAAAKALQGLLADPGAPERCRTTAERHVGLEEVLLPRYRAAYGELLSSGR